MLGPSFINARNAEVDRNRRLRRENSDAFKAFVELQKSTGGRVDPEEFHRFAGSLGTTPYLAGGLPTEGVRNQMAGAINAEVAAREVARANAARAASIARATSELDAFGKLVGTLSTSGLDLNSDEGRATLGEMAKNLGIDNISPYESLVPGIKANALGARSMEIVKELNGLGINTEAAAAPFLLNLPEPVRKAVNTALQSGESARALAAETEAIKALKLDEIIKRADGDVDRAVAIASQGLRTLSPEGEQQLREALEAEAEGRQGVAVRGAIATLTAPANMEALADYRNNPEGLRALARAALVQQGVTEPTEAQVEEVMRTLSSVAEASAFGEIRRIEENVLRTLETASASSPEIVGALRTPEEVQAYINSVLASAGRSLADLSAGARERLIQTVTMRATAIREGSTALRWNRLLGGSHDNDPVGQTFLNNMLARMSDTPESRLAAMNMTRTAYGMTPFENTSDPGFLQAENALRVHFETTIRAKAEAERAKLETEATAIAGRHGRKAQQDGVERALQALGVDPGKSATGRVMNLVDSNYYFGSATTPYEVVSFTKTLIEGDRNLEKAILDGDGEALERAATAIAARFGIPLIPAGGGDDDPRAVGFETNRLAASRRVNTIPIGQPVPEFLSERLALLDRRISGFMANVALQPADVDPSRIATARDTERSVVAAAIEQTRRDLRDPRTLYLLSAAGADVPALLQEFERQVGELLERMDGATPQGARSGVTYNPDTSTVTLAPNNMFGREPGTYEAERSPDGARWQPGRPLSVAPPAPQTPEAAPPPRGSETVGGDMGSIPGWLNRGLATRDAARQEERAAEDFFRSPEGQEYLRANPGSVQLLQRDPVAWWRLATTGSTASGRATSVATPPR